MTSTPRTILLAAVLLAIAGVVAFVLLSTAPKTQPAARERAAKLVQTITLTPRDVKVEVTGFGNVIPARQLTIQPEVSGRITAQHEVLVPGGLVDEGEELLAIDRSNYELALAEKHAAREEARFELQVEKGRQTIAARELEELKMICSGPTSTPPSCCASPISAAPKRWSPWPTMRSPRPNSTSHDAPSNPPQRPRARRIRRDGPTRGQRGGRWPPSSGPMPSGSASVCRWRIWGAFGSRPRTNPGPQRG